MEIITGVGGATTPASESLADASSITPSWTYGTGGGAGGTLIYTGAGALTINPFSGSPGVTTYTLAIKSTNAVTINWGTGTEFSGSADMALPATLSGAGKWDYFTFKNNPTAAKNFLLGRNMGF